jgi:hypothetical protein
MYAHHFEPYEVKYPPISDVAFDVARHSPRPHDWQSAVIADYVSAADDLALHLRRRLDERVVALTGRTIPPRDITVNLAARRALATLDDVVFQVCGHSLNIVRPCAHCGTGRFESAPITDRADLGYALAVWQAYHPECEPSDPPDDTSW